MKILIKEILDPVKDFYLMRERKKKEFAVFIVVPLLFGIGLFACEELFDAIRPLDIDDFIGDLLNQIITVLALFISFSMAYLSILLSSESKTIGKMRNYDSKEYYLNGNPVKLFQVLMCDITYTMVIEVIFLFFVFFEKFFVLICSLKMLRVLISINVILLAHVLILLMIIVKNIYFAFWKS